MLHVSRAPFLFYFSPSFREPFTILFLQYFLKIGGGKNTTQFLKRKGEQFIRLPFPNSSSKPTLPRMGNHRATVSDAVRSQCACPQRGCPPPRGAFVAKEVVVTTAALLLRATKHAGESSSGSQVCVTAPPPRAPRRAHGRTGHRATGDRTRGRAEPPRRANGPRERPCWHAATVPRPPTLEEGHRLPCRSRLQDRG